MQLGTKVIMQKHMAKEYTFWLKRKALCLGQINTSLSNCFLIFKHGGGCIVVWVFLISAKTGEFIRIKRNGAKNRQNPRGKPALICFTPDTGRGIHLSAEQ